jgi:predicted ATPase
VCHAVERAMAEGARPWDVVVYADLESAGDADDVVRIVAREAKVRLDSSETPEVALARALSRLGRVLLVLDPVEHVASALSAALLVFQRLAHDVQVLATSRSRFSPAGAVTVELGPLATAAEGGVSPAAALVLARARSFLSTFGAAPESDASGETVALAERLATLLDGIPLAIELTVSRIHLLGLRGLVDAVESRRARKTPSDRTLTTMSETLDRSWLLLSEDEQRALSACAVFRGGFTVDAATAVLGAQTSEDALAPLLRLREQSLLLSRDEGDGKVRLFLSGAVHDYALEKLSEHGESAAWFARHGAHYAARFFAERGRVDAVHLSLVEREAENLLAAAERGLEGDGVAIADAARGLVALEPAVFARGAVSAFAALLDRAVDIADASTSALSDPTVTIPVRQIRARLDAVSGRLGRARHDLEKSLEESQRIADDPLRGAVLLDLGVVHHFEQDLPAARARYEAALPLLRQANDAASEGRCVGNLGALQHDEGAFSLAARSYRHAIALLESVGESPRRANFITNLALLEHELDRLESARRLYEQALSLLESLRNARLLGIALGNFALLEIELGNRADALELCERSSRLLAGLADTRSEALAAARQGVVLSLSERLGEAEMALSRAEHLASGTVTAEVVACARAFLDIGWARAARDAAELLECLQLARARLERASVAQGGERPLRERSDDVRLLLRIALPLLEALTPAR